MSAVVITPCNSEPCAFKRGDTIMQETDFVSKVSAQNKLKVFCNRRAQSFGPLYRVVTIERSKNMKKRWLSLVTQA